MGVVWWLSVAAAVGAAVVVVPYLPLVMLVAPWNPRNLTVTKQWDLLSPKGERGKVLFSLLVCLVSPYSATLLPYVAAIQRHSSTVLIKERLFLRNPFRSIHAAALFNVAEMASGLAALYDLPKNQRGIVTDMSITFVKKARGTIVANAKLQSPEQADVLGVRKYVINLVNVPSNELVATAVATWTISETK